MKMIMVKSTEILSDGEPADDQLHVSLRQARFPSEARDH